MWLVGLGVWFSLENDIFCCSFIRIIVFSNSKFKFQFLLRQVFNFEVCTFSISIQSLWDPNFSSIEKATLSHVPFCLGVFRPRTILYWKRLQYVTMSYIMSPFLNFWPRIDEHHATPFKSNPIAIDYSLPMYISSDRQIKQPHKTRTVFTHITSAWNSIM